MVIKKCMKKVSIDGDKTEVLKKHCCGLNRQTGDPAGLLTLRGPKQISIYPGLEQLKKLGSKETLPLITLSDGPII